MAGCAVMLAGLCASLPAFAAEEKSAAEPLDNKAVCALLQSVAEARRIPPGFLARLIWQESRFNRFAVSPKGAEGIAQFMPGTAAERNLRDPFHIPSALRASAALLHDLSTAFGNLGLAAAAYNAGAYRVTRWLAGVTTLPLETQDYVLAITGLSAEEWRADEVKTPNFLLDKELDFNAACVKLASSGPAVSTVKLAPPKPWGMQVAADFSREKALSRFTRLKRQYQSVLGETDPLVVRYRSASRGPRALFAVRIGAETRNEAQQLCTEFRARGGSCIVMKN